MFPKSNFLKSVTALSSVTFALGVGFIPQAYANDTLPITPSLDYASSEVQGGKEVTFTLPSKLPITFKDIDAGEQHSLAVGSDGRVYAWGTNKDKKVGQNSDATVDHPEPIINPLTTDDYPQGIATYFKQVAAGSSHSLGIGAAHTVMAWGTMKGKTLKVADREFKTISLGDERTEISAAPVQAELDDDEGRKDPVEITAGSNFTIVRNAEGNLVSWGKNDFGQLGLGCDSSKPDPDSAVYGNKCPRDHNHFEDVDGNGVKFTNVDAGYEHAAAISQDGKLYVWGKNDRGSLGVDSKDNQTKPVLAKTSGKENISFKQVSAGKDFTLALSQDGSLYAVGKNNNYQLGNGSNKQLAELTKINSSVKFKQVSAGTSSAVAVAEDGTVYAWGGYYFPHTPTKVSDEKISNVKFTKVSAGAYHNLALAENGKIYSFGGNGGYEDGGIFGIFGDGKYVAKNAPSIHEVKMPEDANVEVKDIYFGQKHADNLKNLGNGKWQVTVPANEVGFKDIRIEYSLNNVRSINPVILKNAFEYKSPAPPITAKGKPETNQLPEYVIVQKGTPESRTLPEFSLKTYKDVNSESLFYNEINWITQAGIARGWDDGTYRPLESIERGAVAAYFYRMAGSPEFQAPAVSPFKDVSTTDPFYKEISWMQSKGITKGWADGTFRPHDPVKRDAIAAFFYRYAGSPSVDTAKSSAFTDVRPGDLFYTEISWLASNRITLGWEDKTFRPTLPIKRDAMAAFIYRYQMQFDKFVPEG